MNKLYKKITITFVLLFCLIFNIKDVSAASASVSVYASSSSVSVGNTVTVTVTVSESGGKLGSWNFEVSHDSSYLSLTSGSEGVYGEVGDGSATSKTYTLKYKALKEGTTSVKVSYADVRDWDSESSLSVSKGSTSITIATVTKSSDTNLKSLSVEGATLSPEFNKDTLEYSATLPSETTKVNITAEANDSKSTVSGAGEVEVEDGDNVVKITVTAENGSLKTYVLNLTVEELNPITVEVDGKSYTIIRKKGVLDPPDGYEETTVMIGEEEVRAYTNSVTGYTLIGLKDEDGNNAWYVYDEKNETYTKYIELESSNVRIVLLTPDEDDIPYKYYKTTFEFNGEEIEGYTFDAGADFRLVYGLNVETGEEAFYVYDISEKTIQRFYNAQVLIYIELVKKCKILLISLAAIIFIMFILIIVLLRKNIKFKKNYINKRTSEINKNKYENKREDEIKYQDV